ncbi:MAG: DUF4159 domain-containing protein, partial [Planctomycetes bacterium]|nr:DUF4159 domain-containing protein [Planctomycetota bacterium]
MLNHAKYLSLLLALCVTLTGYAQSPKGDPDDLQCANLIYAVSKSSVCFSDKFLATVRRETNCKPNPNFASVKLATEAMFEHPFAVMTGEGQFVLTAEERRVLKSYLTRGGFLLASAGCSSKEWDLSFRQEIQKVFPDKRMARIKLSHPIFHTVFDIRNITLKKGGTAYLEGLVLDGKIVMIYSGEGLNDTANATKDGGKKCCCCGG